MAASSKQAVLLAILGNATLTLLKIVAFAFSGSGAMLSEAIHSAADTGNQLLLWVGIRRSERPPDAMFAYGFGGERFLFALLSAIGIFVLGCGVTVYHGIHILLQPPELSFGWLTFVVLAVSLVVDGLVLLQAIRAIDAQRGQTDFLTYLRTTSDPTVAAVLLEDSVACLGVLIAAAGIGLAAWTGSHVPDAVATLLIGGLMGLIAVWLGYKNSRLVIGPSIPREVEDSALAYLRSQPTVRNVRRVRSRVLGADRFRLKAEVDWNGSALAERLEGWVEEQQERLATEEGRRQFGREFAERIAEAIGDEVDRIEAELRDRHPELVHLDFETD